MYKSALISINEYIQTGSLEKQNTSASLRFFRKPFNNHLKAASDIDGTFIPPTLVPEQRRVCIDVYLPWTVPVEMVGPVEPCWRISGQYGAVK